MLSRGEAVSFLEAACEMGHVGEPPTVSDFADCSMRLRRIFQASPATRKPPCLNQTVKRSVYLDRSGFPKGRDTQRTLSRHSATNRQRELH